MIFECLSRMDERANESSEWVRDTLSNTNEQNSYVQATYLINFVLSASIYLNFICMFFWVFTAGH